MGDLGSARDDLIKAAKQAIERRVMTDTEFVPQLPAIWAEIRKDI